LTFALISKCEFLLFCRQMGFPSPDAIVRSEVEEDIPQLARHTFLKGAWAGIVPDDDLSWIGEQEGSSKPGSKQPYAGVADAIRKLKAQGTDMRALAEIVRGMQAQLLFHIAYQLSDPDSVAGNDGSIGWALVEASEDGEFGREISGLHESVLGTDPTGRDMRPRDWKMG
jgi:hypothetical protein